MHTTGDPRNQEEYLRWKAHMRNVNYRYQRDNKHFYYEYGREKLELQTHNAYDKCICFSELIGPVARGQTLTDFKISIRPGNDNPNRPDSD